MATTLLGVGEGKTDVHLFFFRILNSFLRLSLAKNFLKKMILIEYKNIFCVKRITQYAILYNTLYTDFISNSASFYYRTHSIFNSVTRKIIPKDWIQFYSSKKELALKSYLENKWGTNFEIGFTWGEPTLGWEGQMETLAGRLSHH